MLSGNGRNDKRTEPFRFFSRDDSFQNKRSRRPYWIFPLMPSWRHGLGNFPFYLFNLMKMAAEMKFWSWSSWEQTYRKLFRDSFHVRQLKSALPFPLIGTWRGITKSFVVSSETPPKRFAYKLFYSFSFTCFVVLMFCVTGRQRWEKFWILVTCIQATECPGNRQSLGPTIRS